MALFGKLFAPLKPRDPVAAANIKRWLSACLASIDPAEEEGKCKDLKLEDIAVTVSEIICKDVACPGTETIILIMRPYHATRALKISKPMDRVTEMDIQAAMAN